MSKYRICLNKLTTDDITTLTSEKPSSAEVFRIFSNVVEGGIGHIQIWDYSKEFPKILSALVKAMEYERRKKNVNSK